MRIMMSKTRLDFQIDLREIRREPLTMSVSPSEAKVLGVLFRHFVEADSAVFNHRVRALITGRDPAGEYRKTLAGTFAMDLDLLALRGHGLQLRLATRDFRDTRVATALDRPEAKRLADDIRGALQEGMCFDRQLRTCVAISDKETRSARRPRAEDTTLSRIHAFDQLKASAPNGVRQ